MGRPGGGSLPFPRRGRTLVFQRLSGTRAIFDREPGHRIGTAEVESALVSHPAVAEAAAIGVPDPLKGECIKAFVQVRSDHVPSDALAAALIEHVRRELGPIATPSSLEFVASLPKTRSGKILRRFLKAKEAGVDAGDVSTMEG